MRDEREPTPFSVQDDLLAEIHDAVWMGDDEQEPSFDEGVSRAAATPPPSDAPAKVTGGRRNPAP